MLRHMRTTVRLPDDLMAAAKRYAADSDRTLTALIEDAIRAELHRASALADAQRFSIEVTQGSGLQPGIDLADGRDLAEQMAAS